MSTVPHPWLIVEGGALQDQIILKCLRCGTVHPILLPMNMGELRKLLEAFLLLHTDC